MGGLEPPTSSLSGMRSNHLSYTPVSESRDKPLEGCRLACVKDTASLLLIESSNRGGRLRDGICR